MMKSAYNGMPPTIAIIGGGVGGSLTAIQLLRSASERLDIHLIERTGSFGRGVAYGTEQYTSLLNVPAGKMSAFPDDPKHFLRWLHTTNFRDTQGQAATESSYLLPDANKCHCLMTTDKSQQATDHQLSPVR